jgi:alpha-methylacyl-CoA racemase
MSTAPTTPPSTDHQPWKPLTGVTILDLTRMLPGGTATLMLADLGATVLKIEHPDGGDATRGLSPNAGPDSSAQHQYLDRGKTSIRADFKRRDDLERVLALVPQVDAVIESFRPGVADRLGLGFSSLVAVRPGLVYVSLTGYGQSGPRATSAGHDLNFVGYAGAIADGLPTTLQADVAGGLLAALAIVAGIHSARATGEPAHIDIALADGALIVGGQQIVENVAGVTLGVPVVTPLAGTHPCYGVYRTADGGRIAIAAIETKFWKRVCELIAKPEWVDRQNDATLIPEFAALIATASLAHWTELLERDDTCVSAVRDMTEVLDDEQFLARGALAQFDSPVGPLWQPASPFHEISGTATQGAAN